MSFFKQFCGVRHEKIVDNETFVITLNDDNSWIHVDGVDYPRSTLIAVWLWLDPRIVNSEDKHRLTIWIKAGDGPETRYRSPHMSFDQSRSLHQRLVGNFSTLKMEK